MLQSSIRYLSYPLVMGASAGAIIAMNLTGVSPWPWSMLVALGGAVTVGLLERFAPYEPAWLHSQGDLAADLWHNLVNLSLIQFVSFVMFQWTASAPWQPWPKTWPYWAQLVLVAVIVDSSLYAMHWVSHKVQWLWDLHAVHHSPERLYWFNGERRHPLHAVLLAAPALVVLALLAAPQDLIGVWFAILTVHLAFQHSNLNYTIGPLKGWIAVAEMHRWHHKREFEDAQVNYGEFLLVWDRLFGTYYDAPIRIGHGEVGLRDRTFPLRYWAQLLWPFKQRG